MTGARSARKQGYQVVSTTRFLMEMQGASLPAHQPGGDRFSWQGGDLSGLENDLPDAIGSALQCLVMERIEEVSA